jgi:beta-1,4-mannooligosaccharide/beta-1,4-mannosyl-N-acetylglucosamine phosphorylase
LKHKNATTILKRCEENPILHIKDYPRLAQLFNPAVVKHQNEFIMLVSVVEFDSELGVGQTRIAKSTDGVHFELSDDDYIKVPNEFPYADMWHFIDNRVTKIDDTYYIITPAMHKNNLAPVGLLGKTKDFTDYEIIDIITAPSNRGASLFPEKINGLYYKLDRPYAEMESGEIWISSSPDLVNWGSFKPVLSKGYSFWNRIKIGPTPPIKTDKGFLVITHGVTKAAGGTYYFIGAMMLDSNEPWKVIGKTSSYLLQAEEEYEKHGCCDNCVFPATPYADLENDMMYLYYGAADSSIALATGKISEIVDACLEGI